MPLALLIPHLQQQSTTPEHPFLKSKMEDQQQQQQQQQQRNSPAFEPVATGDLVYFSHHRSGQVTKVFRNGRIKVQLSSSSSSSSSENNNNKLITIKQKSIHAIAPRSEPRRNEIFAAWCRPEIMDSESDSCEISDYFRFRHLPPSSSSSSSSSLVNDYEIPLNNTRALQLEHALRSSSKNSNKLESFTFAPKNTLLQPQNLTQERLIGLAQAIATLPNLKDLCLEDITSQVFVDAVAQGLGEELAILHLRGCCLPTSSEHALSNLCSKVYGLYLSYPRLLLLPRNNNNNNNNLEHYRPLAAQIALPSSEIRCIDFIECPFEFICLFLREWSRQNSFVEHLGVSCCDETNPSERSRAQLLDAFSTFMAGRNIGISPWEPFHISWEQNGKDLPRFIDVLLRHDKFVLLDIDGETIDNEIASAIAKLLREKRTLLSLRLSERPDDWVCSEDKKVEILQSLAVNQSLYEFTSGCLSPQAVLLALQQNQIVRKLTLNPGTSGPGHLPIVDLEALPRLYTLQILKIKFLRVHLGSLRGRVRLNISLEDIEIKGQRKKDDQVQAYLDRNKWFNRHRLMLLHAFGSIPTFVWPFIFARVSTNPTFVFLITNAYPALFDECGFTKKRPRSPSLMHNGVKACGETPAALSPSREQGPVSGCLGLPARSTGDDDSGTDYQRTLLEFMIGTDLSMYNYR